MRIYIPELGFSSRDFGSNGQWNNGNVFMIKLQKCIKYDSGTTKCTIIEQKIPNNIISKSVKLFGQCYFYCPFNILCGTSFSHPDE
jgi:hypothetical protein